MQETQVQTVEQPNSEKKQSLAEKAGYIPEEIIIEIEPDESEKIEPSGLSTKGNLWDRSGKRTIAIGGGVFLAVIVFSVIGKSFFSLTNNNNQKPKEPTQQPLQKGDTEDDIGTLKTNNAIGSQKEELKKINSHSPTSTPSPTATPTPTAIPTATPTSKSTQTVHTPAPKLTPAPQSPTRQSIHAPESMEMAHFTPPRQPQPQIMTVRMPPQSSAITTLPSAPAPSVDPNVAWQAAANIGMYGDGTDSDASKPVTKYVKPPTVENSPNPTSPTADYNNGRSVIIGSHANGRLETALAWTLNGNSQNQQSYLIKLTEPLKSADGTVVIPKETMIVAHVKSATEGGLLEMSAVSAVESEQNGVIEKSIPEGAILIQGGGGSPLKAEYHTPSHFGADIRTAALAGIGKASEIYNSSDSSISISNGGGSASSYSNSRRNIVAGVLQGSTQELVNRAQQANNRILQQQNNNSRILTLDKGASVRLFVNRSFSW